ncbi:hypothetical protein X798_07332, partial [Onchocerca flexuosa]
NFTNKKLPQQSFFDNLSDNQSKLTRLAYDIKLYVKKLNETNEKFPEEFVKGMDKINEIEQDARKIIETINNIRNTHNEEEYEKNMAIICGTNVP